MRTIVFIIIIASTSLFACKNSSQAMGADQIEPVNTKQNIKTIGDNMKISFISKASGVDQKVKEKVDAVMVSFAAKNKVELKYEKKHWGREGEFDYNFDLKNLSTSQKKSFVSLIKGAIGTSDMARMIFL
jgi:hypothetical protein